MKIGAIIVAAGRGERAGGGIPKQFRKLAGRSVLARSYQALAAHPAITAIVLVNPSGRYRPARRGGMKSWALSPGESPAGPRAPTRYGPVWRPSPMPAWTP